MDELRLRLELDLTIDSEYQVTVNAVRTVPVLEGNLIIETGRVTKSSFRYGLITYPAKSSLPLMPGDQVKVKYKELLTNLRLGAKPGRLTGLTSIINKNCFRSEFDVGDEIELRYDESNRILELRKPRS